ncbi:MAG: hypothetical protein EKK42_20190 [Pseudonocardiaceae bacterium]|nr:MAG: hypothetical protein EKK42_20190 [Pseudonocardiaceae bacterium]
MTTTVKVPDTVDLLRSELSDLAGLASATGWKLAALVWAWCSPQQGSRTDLRHNCRTLSVEGLSDLGIRGLKSHVTVRRYRSAWQQAIDAGLAASVKPGEETELPSVDFGEFVNQQRDPPATARAHPRPVAAPHPERDEPVRPASVPRPTPETVHQRSDESSRNAMRREVSQDIAIPWDLQTRALQKYAERALDAAESTPGELGIQATRLVEGLMDVVLGDNPKHSYLRCFDAVVEMLAAVGDN